MCCPEAATATADEEFSPAVQRHYSAYKSASAHHRPRGQACVFAFTANRRGESHEIIEHVAMCQPRVKHAFVRRLQPAQGNSANLAPRRLHWWRRILVECIETGERRQIALEGLPGQRLCWRVLLTAIANACRAFSTPWHSPAQCGVRDIRPHETRSGFFSWLWMRASHSE